MLDYSHKAAPAGAASQPVSVACPEAAMPTTAPIASIAGAMQVHQALLYLHGKTGLLDPGEKIFLGLNPWTAFKMQIQRRETCLAHDLSIEPAMYVKYEPNMKVQEVLKQLDTSGYSEPVIWLRNEVIGKMTCQKCGYEEQANTPLRKYQESQQACPKCGYESRDFEVIRNLTLEDSCASVILEELCLTTNEILHCETAKGQIAIQFCQT